MRRFALVVEADPHGRVQTLEVGQALFLDGDAVTIGRAETSTIHIAADNVSRAHCRLQNDNGKWVARDDKSTSGTWVNGRRIAGRRILERDDRFRFGDVSIRFDAVDPDPLARAKRLGEFVVVDADDLSEPGVRRGFKPKSGLVTIVSMLQAEARPQPIVEPKCVATWRDDVLVHEAYAVAGGVPLTRIARNGEKLERNVVARVVVDAADIVERVMRPAGLMPMTRDVVVTWDGAVVVLPVHALPATRASIPDWFIARVGLALGEDAGSVVKDVERARAGVGGPYATPSTSAELAAIVRAWFAADYAAYVELAEQVATLDDDGVAWLLERG